jgi:hypothetical protein
LKDLLEQLSMLQSALKILVESKLEQIQLSSKMPDEKLSEKLIAQDAKVEAAEQSVQDAQVQYHQILAKGGIIVSNWQRQSQRKGGVSALSSNEIRGGKSDQDEGYLIMVNPRILTLEFGEDLFALLDEIKSRNAGDIQKGECRMWKRIPPTRTLPCFHGRMQKMKRRFRLT